MQQSQGGSDWECRRLASTQKNDGPPTIAVIPAPGLKPQYFNIPGYCAAEYTPTRRGFDTFLGFYLGSQNHFTHDRDYKSLPNDPPAFYDFREGEEVAKTNYQGVYSTQIFKSRTKDIIKSVADRRELNAYGNYQPFFTFLSFQVRKYLSNVPTWVFSPRQHMRHCKPALR